MTTLKQGLALLYCAACCCSLCCHPFHYLSPFSPAVLWGCVVFLPTPTVCMCLASAGLLVKALAAQPALLGLLTGHVHTGSDRSASLTESPVHRAPGRSGHWCMGLIIWGYLGFIATLVTNNWCVSAPGMHMAGHSLQVHSLKTC